MVSPQVKVPAGLGIIFLHAGSSGVRPLPMALTGGVKELRNLPAILLCLLLFWHPSMTRSPCNLLAERGLF